MKVRVEFLGMPRQYAERDFVDVDGETVAEAMLAVAAAVPSIGKCFDGAQLRPGYLLGVNGRFDDSAPARVLAEGDALQILSADVGGH